MHQAEEEFRRIKWPLLNAIAHREGARPAANNMVLVTSAIPGEGKTFNALNLALSIARDRDLEVLLVDGDVAQPSLTASLGLTGRPGVTNLLRDTTMVLADIVYSTNIPQLEVVPAGVRQDNAAELLAGARMQAVVDQLCARVSSGVVIVDSPPILATNVAQVITRYAGQVLMVVRADSTEQRVLTEALSLIDKSRPVSAVLNRVEPSLVSRYYSHYYYGYGRSAAK
jgi:exopolysaccharide/PEP-CTERM locus tyrosine autokinase